jgi:SagB-type dehydrogenase family enzyme
MRKYFLSLTILLLLNFCTNTEVGDIIKLPEPKKEGGMPLYEALNKRRSLRDFNDSIEVPQEILSQALWSCYGFNEDQHRTVPSAKSWYPFLVYVFLKDGVYKYNPLAHELIKLFDGDHRAVSGTQTSIVTKAAINFVFIGNLRKESRIKNDSDKHLAFKLDIGHITQVLSLFAAANDMKGVVRGNVHTNQILDFLHLSPNDYAFTLAFSLGY